MVAGDYSLRSRQVLFLFLIALRVWALPPVSGTDSQIEAAQQRAKRTPGDYAAYDELGVAYLQKTRETGDVAYFGLAEKALAKSLELVPQDFHSADPLVHMALVYMGEHSFNNALVYSQKAIALGAGNLPAFAIEGDAYTDLGKYDDAQNAYDALRALGSIATSAIPLDYMLDSRRAYLSFVHGHSADAIALMKSAINAGMQTNVPKENLAWLYFELGERYFQAGDLANAELSYQAGIAADPNHYRSLAGLAKVRAAQGRLDESIGLYQRSIDVVPFPQYVADLGDVYKKAGKSKDAQQQYDLVEYIAQLSTLSKVLANRELAVFYADHDIQLPQALELARLELTVRRDIYTWDALAWALYKNQKFDEAGKAVGEALRYNTEDSLLLFHAGMINQALGRKPEAAAFLDRALRLNPHFHVFFESVAVRTLAEIRSSRKDP